jgi:uncharacterized protein (DUF1697 family)
MPQYVGLLRGVNVGGHNKVKMVDLKAQLEEAGCSDVITYIQSGNIILRSNLASSEVATLMETTIHTHFGLTIPTVVLTAEAFGNVVQECPFTTEMQAQASESDVEQLYVAFLTSPATADEINALKSAATGDEQLWVSPHQNALYLRLPNGIRETKLFTRFPKTVSTTVRNWRTTVKIQQLTI